MSGSRCPRNAVIPRAGGTSYVPLSISKAFAGHAVPEEDELAKISLVLMASISVMPRHAPSHQIWSHGDSFDGKRFEYPAAGVVLILRRILMEMADDDCCSLVQSWVGERGAGSHQPVAQEVDTVTCGGRDETASCPPIPGIEA